MTSAVFFSATPSLVDIFSFHVAAAFSNQSVVQVLSRTHIPVYLINKLPPLYRGILTSWVQLKGTNDNGSWGIPRPSNDPIIITELTAKISYLLTNQLVISY